MQHHEVGAGEPHKPQEDMNSLLLNIKTEPDLLDIHSFVYSDEHEDLSTSENRWGCESDPEDEYSPVQCDDGRSMLTIIKTEPPEEELSFCGERQSNCKTESIEISIEEDECDVSLEENGEVNMTGRLDEFESYC